MAHRDWSRSQTALSSLGTETAIYCGSLVPRSSPAPLHGGNGLGTYAFAFSAVSDYHEKRFSQGERCELFICSFVYLSIFYSSIYSPTNVRLKINII